MTRQQIVDTTYEAILRLNRLKAKYGIISKQMAQMGEERLKAASEMLWHIEDIMAKGNDVELSGLKARVDEINMFPVSEKMQLELPLGLVKLKPWRCLWSWATGQR